MKTQVKKRYILVVDGYNIINAWTELSDMASHDLGAAREMLNQRLVEYLSYHNMEGYVIYDAYNVRTKTQRHEVEGRLHIIFTRENQTADSFIEKFISDYKNKRHYVIRVVTNDMAEQQHILGKGASRMTARELELELLEGKKEVQKRIHVDKITKNTLDYIVDETTMQKLDKLRKNQ